MCDWIKIFCIFLDDIIKKNRNGPGNRRGRGRGGNAIQRRGGNNQRGGRGGRVGKNNNNNFSLALCYSSLMKYTSAISYVIIIRTGRKVSLVDGCK